LDVSLAWQVSVVAWAMSCVVLRAGVNAIGRSLRTVSHPDPRPVRRFLHGLTIDPPAIIFWGRATAGCHHSGLFTGADTTPVQVTVMSSGQIHLPWSGPSTWQQNSCRHEPYGGLCQGSL
jgi:hypothetical protein